MIGCGYRFIKGWFSSMLNKRLYRHNLSGRLETFQDYGPRVWIIKYKLTRPYIGSEPLYKKFEESTKITYRSQLLERGFRH